MNVRLGLGVISDGPATSPSGVSPVIDVYPYVSRALPAGDVSTVAFCTKDVDCPLKVFGGTQETQNDKITVSDFSTAPCGGAGTVSTSVSPSAVDSTNGIGSYTWPSSASAQYGVDYRICWAKSPSPVSSLAAFPTQASLRPCMTDALRAAAQALFPTACFHLHPTRVADITSVEPVRAMHCPACPTLSSRPVETS
jgi:hypothetical protein